MDGQVKFVRIRGRVVPIRADQMDSTKLSKKQRASASDTISNKDAALSLRRHAKMRDKISGAFGLGAIAGYGATALGVGLHFTKWGQGAAKTKLTAATVGAAFGGVASRIAMGASQSAAKQYRKDASRIAKDKPLKAARYNEAAGATGRFLEKYLPRNAQTILVEGTTSVGG